MSTVSTLLSSKSLLMFIPPQTSDPFSMESSKLMMSEIVQQGAPHSWIDEKVAEGGARYDTTQSHEFSIFMK